MPRYQGVIISFVEDESVPSKERFDDPPCHELEVFFIYQILEGSFVVSGGTPGLRPLIPRMSRCGICIVIVHILRGLSIGNRLGHFKGSHTTYHEVMVILFAVGVSIHI